MSFKKGDPKNIELGRQGGLKTKQRMLEKNPYYYAEVGDLGGLATKTKYGREYYSAIGKISPGQGKQARGRAKQ